MVVATKEPKGAIYDAKTFEPCKSIGYLMNRVRTEILSAVDEKLAPLDVTSAQYIIMAHLAHNLAGSASELCKGIAYDPGAMTRMVDRLETKGLIRRVRSPDDRRAVKLELTGEGVALFPKMRAGVVDVLNHFMRDFTRSEARQLESLLARMLASA